MKRTLAIALPLLGLLASARAEGPRQLKPGFNLFSREQDIQLGKEAAAQVEQQMTVLGDSPMTEYVRRIGQKLASTPEAGGYPYTFKLVNEKSINAFALPGGPAFVHTGLILAADNEAQVAGVLAHEISHVALRHGTNQASKANLIQLPAVLAGAMAGQSGSLLGTLAQLGVGIGANSVLLKFSRNAERDADLLGTRMMAKAGYNPIEMARFFEKLEAEGGSRGPQFLSDHPNPGNRVKAVQDEIRYLPRQDYTTGDPREFARIQKLVAAVPAPPPRPKQAAGAQGGAPPVPDSKPSRNLREYQTDSYTVSYPDNWQVLGEQHAPNVTLAPKEGVVQSGSGTAIGIGAIIGLDAQASGGGDLRRDTDDLTRRLSASNPGTKVQGSKSVRVDGNPGLLTTLETQSPYAGETEIDSVATVERPGGLFYVVLIAPRSRLGDLQGTFDAMLRSLRFGK